MGASENENETVTRVVATAAAVELQRKLAATHGPVLFHQSGGCCDGSAPMCYPVGDFIVSDGDICLGSLGDAPFYVSASQFEYLKYSQLIIDVAPGRGGMFSLENGTGQRFLTRSRIFSDAEIAALSIIEPPAAGLAPARATAGDRAAI